MEHLNNQLANQAGTNFRARLELEINSRRIEQIEEKIESLETRLKLIEQSPYYSEIHNFPEYLQANNEIDRKFSLVDTLFIKAEYLDVYKIGLTLDEIEIIISEIYQNVIRIENLIRSQMHLSTTINTNDWVSLTRQQQNVQEHFAVA